MQEMVKRGKTAIAVKNSYLYTDFNKIERFKRRSWINICNNLLLSLTIRAIFREIAN